jgi:argininosuccinate lyase
MVFREAHATVGHMVAYCLEKKCHLQDLPLNIMQQFSPLIKDCVYAILTIDHTVQANIDKRPSALSIAGQLIKQQQLLATQQAWLIKKSNAINTIYQAFNLV